MQMLEMTITLKRTEVLVGESLPLQVILKNPGTAVIEVPNPEGPTEFEFILRDAADGRVVRVLSFRASMDARSPDPLPPLSAVKHPLNPGESLIYERDMSQYAIDPIPVGQYRLSAAYDFGSTRIESQDTPLSIIPERLCALATVLGPSEGRLAVVFGHSEPNGSVAIYQLESDLHHPGYGTAYRRIDLVPPLPVVGVASAIEFDWNPGRWFAWIQGDAIGAALGRGRKLRARAASIPLGLEMPILQPVGWQPTVDSAYFVALGLDPQKRLTLAAVKFYRTDNSDVKTVQLTGLKMPLHWAARYQGKNGTVQFDIVTGEDVNGKIRIQRQSVLLDKVAAEPPILLVERSEPLAALALYPVADASPGIVDVLLGPVGEKGQMTFLRLPIDGGAPVAEWTFVVPEDPEKKQPSAWAIAPQPVSNPIVLTKIGDRLMVRRADSESEWSILAENASQAEYLRLEAIGNQVAWAIWFDPAMGIQYKRIEL
jgi:hypothetical protein